MIIRNSPPASFYHLRSLPSVVPLLHPFEPSQYYPADKDGMICDGRYLVSPCYSEESTEIAKVWQISFFESKRWLELYFLWTPSTMATLLPFHKNILERIHDPSTSDLIILARGLGLRRIICTLLRIYDSPQNLVLLVNATPEEESAIGEELGIMGCRKPGLRVVGHEIASKDRCLLTCRSFPSAQLNGWRQELYRRGGIISVTSRILVVDMLKADIPIQLITGMLVMHAERWVDQNWTFEFLSIHYSRIESHL